MVSKVEYEPAYAFRTATSVALMLIPNAYAIIASVKSFVSNTIMPAHNRIAVV
jgi:hypothetical protein